MISDSNDETNFPQKLLLNNTQVSRLHKTFEKDSLAYIELSKTQLSKMILLRENFFKPLTLLNAAPGIGPMVSSMITFCRFSWKRIYKYSS